MGKESKKQTNKNRKALCIHLTDSLCYTPRTTTTFYTPVKKFLKRNGLINIYAPNIGAPQYVRQMLTSMKGEINNNSGRL